jgi:hypothetical protein
MAAAALKKESDKVGIEPAATCTSQRKTKKKISQEAKHKSCRRDSKAGAVTRQPSSCCE